LASARRGTTLYEDPLDVVVRDGIRQLSRSL
jgi:hypothetical protein